MLIETEIFFLKLLRKITCYNCSKNRLSNISTAAHNCFPFAVFRCNKMLKPHQLYKQLLILNFILGNKNRNANKKNDFLLISFASRRYLCFSFTNYEIQCLEFSKRWNRNRSRQKTKEVTAIIKTTNNNILAYIQSAIKCNAKWKIKDKFL